LSGYSKNIICCDLERESTLSAIADGIRLARNAAERSENHRSNGMQSDWRSAFSDIIARIGKSS
jgi:hypothetical protein